MNQARLVTRTGAVGLLALLGSLAACDGWVPPQPPPVASIPAYPDPTTRAPGADKPQVSAFAALRDRVLDQWLADDPSLGRAVGLHDFDARLGDYSAAGIRRVSAA